MRIKTLALYASLGLSLTAACRSDSNSPDSGSGSGIDSGSNGSNGSNGSGGFKKIQDIQNDAMSAGTSVDVQGVIVTAIDKTSSQKGNFWVEEPEGGERSGVLVHHATLADVDALAVGDEVTITGGIKAEFALTGSNGDTSGNTDTELEPASGGTLTIKKTGTGTVPAPVEVDALMIGSLSTKAECASPNATTCATNVAWEKYEGVLIKVTSTGGGGVIAGSVTVGKTANTQDRFNVTGQIDVESTLIGDGTSGSNSGLPAFSSGDCLASVTGVMDYFFQYNLLPVTTAGIATGGTGCPAREQAAGTTIGTCGDSRDNDGNGFADCGDLGCEVGSGAWLGATCASTDAVCGCSANESTGAGIAAINAGTVAPFAPVILNNVVVTAIGATTVKTNGFWVADSTTAVANGGLFVFTGKAVPTVTVGQKIATLQGIAQPFGPGALTATSTPPVVTILEFENATIGTTSVGTQPTAVASTAAAAGSLSGGTQFAGALVKLTNVKVKSAGMFNQFTLVDNANATIVMDDSAFLNFGGNTPTVGTCFASLTGAMTLTTADSAGLLQVRTINPRSAVDMLSVGGTCTGN